MRDQKTTLELVFELALVIWSCISSHLRGRPSIRQVPGASHPPPLIHLPPSSWTIGAGRCVALPPSRRLYPRTRLAPFSPHRACPQVPSPSALAARPQLKPMHAPLPPAHLLPLPAPTMTLIPSLPPPPPPPRLQPHLSPRFVPASTVHVPSFLLLSHATNLLIPPQRLKAPTLPHMAAPASPPPLSPSPSHPISPHPVSSWSRLTM